MLDSFPRSNTEKIQDAEKIYKSLCAKLGSVSLNGSESGRRVMADQMLSEAFKEADKAKQKVILTTMIFQRARDLLSPFVNLEGKEGELLDIADVNSNAIIFRDDDLIRQEGIASMEIESDLCGKYPQLQPLFLDIDNDLELGSRGNDTLSTFYKTVYWTVTEQLSMVDELEPGRINSALPGSASPEVA